LVNGRSQWVGRIRDAMVELGAEHVGLPDRYRQVGEARASCIAGDFPICVVPSLKYDIEEPAWPCAYFCQISDSTTSYGSHASATPNEKITWDKLNADTPMFVIESDATIVAPLLLGALFEYKRHPDEARALIDARRVSASAFPSP
jgi:deoxyhypusine synthase